MDHTIALIRKSHDGDKKAREQIVEENVGLIWCVVKRFSGRGAEAEDLFQIGSIGLLKAIDKFDLSYDVKFSTYAVPMISGEIRRFLRDDGMIKVSRSLKELSWKSLQTREKLTDRLGREPTVEELSTEMGVDKEELVQAMEAGSEVDSLYRPIHQKEGSELRLLDKIEEKERREEGEGKGKKREGQRGTGRPKEWIVQRVLSLLIDFDWTIGHSLLRFLVEREVDDILALEQSSVFLCRNQELRIDLILSIAKGHFREEGIRDKIFRRRSTFRGQILSHGIFTAFLRLEHPDDDVVARIVQDSGKKVNSQGLGQILSGAEERDKSRGDQDLSFFLRKATGDQSVGKEGEIPRLKSRDDSIADSFLLGKDERPRGRQGERRSFFRREGDIPVP